LANTLLVQNLERFDFRMFFSNTQSEIAMSLTGEPEGHLCEVLFQRKNQRSRQSVSSQGCAGNPIMVPSLYAMRHCAHKNLDGGATYNRPDASTVENATRGTMISG
jgi:hypothetical protein